MYTLNSHLIIRCVSYATFSTYILPVINTQNALGKPKMEFLVIFSYCFVKYGIICLARNTVETTCLYLLIIRIDVYVCTVPLINFLVSQVEVLW